MPAAGSRSARCSRTTTKAPICCSGRSRPAQRAREVFLDCPEPNRPATDLAARYGLSPVFETARMYRGAAPALPLARIYGITTFELG